MIEFSDIRDIAFLSEEESFKFDLKFLDTIIKKNKKKIDHKALNLMKEEVEEKRLSFQITPQEINYIKKIKDEDILEYLIYRYKFKEYPKKKISTDFPTYILIEPVSSCNLACTMCFQSDPTFIKKEFMGKMDFNLYKNVIDQAHAGGTNAITFGSRGEPSIHPQIIDFIKYTKGKFLDLKFITNATKLSEELIHALLDSEFNQVVFSIDSEDKKLYEQIRRKAEYENVLSNVKKYNEIKKNEYKNSKTVTRISGVQVTEQQNPSKFNKFWSNYSDEVTFKKAWDRWDTYNNKINKELIKPCNLLWERMYVWWDGKVNPCDSDYKSFLSYGNVKKNTISEIWNSDKLKKLRSLHMIESRGKLTPCDRCGIS